jgi:MoaA/NifB/PqqE/SkfB family radical SAM enzyme/thioredoxin-like negative regulator of GroEL
MNIELQYQTELYKGLEFLKNCMNESQFSSVITKSLDMLKVYSNNENILLELAKAYFFSGNNKEAKNIFFKLLECKNKYAYLFLSRIYKSEQNLPKAEKYLEQANSLFPKDTEITINLIDIYNLLNKSTEATNLATNININSVINDANINHMLIRTFREVNLLDISNKIGEEILSKDHENIKIIIELAYNYIQIKHFEKAEDLLKKIKTDAVELLFAWSELYKAKNNISEYKKIVKKILKKEKYHIGLELSLVDIYSFNKEYKKAIQILKYLIKKYPKDKLTIQSILRKQYRVSNNETDLLSLNLEIFETINNDKNLLIEIIDICLQRYKFVEALQTIFKFKNDDNINLEPIKDNLYDKLLEYIHEKNINGFRVCVYKLVDKCLKIIPSNEVKIRNSLLNEQEITEDRIFLTSKPRRMQVVLTNKCNLRCIMCNVHEIDWSFTDQKIKELKELIPYLEYIIWQGGEVFLHKNFSELFELGFKNKVKQTIITNGLLITPDIAEYIVQYGVDLAISIDCVDKDGYEKIRKNANFDQLISNLTLLNKLQDKYHNANFNMKMSVVVMKSNYDKLYDILEFAKKYKFSAIEINPIEFRTRNTDEQIFFVNADYQKIKYLNVLIPKLDEKAKSYGIKIISSIPSESIVGEMSKEREIFDETKVQVSKYISNDKKNINASILNKIKIPDNISSYLKESTSRKYTKLYIKQLLSFVKKIINKKTSQKYCFVPWESVFVDLNGYIMPGCNCYLYCYNTIKNNSILDIWNSKTMILYRINIKNNKYKNICTQQCIYESITVDKRLYL